MSSCGTIKHFHVVKTYIWNIRVWCVAVAAAASLWISPVDVGCTAVSFSHLCDYTITIFDILDIDKFQGFCISESTVECAILRTLWTIDSKICWIKQTFNGPCRHVKVHYSRRKEAVVFSAFSIYTTH